MQSRGLCSTDDSGFCRPNMNMKSQQHSQQHSQQQLQIIPNFDPARPRDAIGFCDGTASDTQLAFVVGPRLTMSISVPSAPSHRRSVRLIGFKLSQAAVGVTAGSTMGLHLAACCNGCVSCCLDQSANHASNTHSC